MFQYFLNRTPLYQLIVNSFYCFEFDIKHSRFSLCFLMNPASQSLAGWKHRATTRVCHYNKLLNAEYCLLLTVYQVFSSLHALCAMLSAPCYPVSFIATTAAPTAAPNSGLSGIYICSRFSFRFMASTNPGL